MNNLIFLNSKNKDKENNIENYIKDLIANIDNYKNNKYDSLIPYDILNIFFTENSNSIFDIFKFNFLKYYFCKKKYSKITLSIDLLEDILNNKDIHVYTKKESNIENTINFELKDEIIFFNIAEFLNDLFDAIQNFNIFKNLKEYELNSLKEILKDIDMISVLKLNIKICNLRNNLFKNENNEIEIKGLKINSKKEIKVLFYKDSLENEYYLKKIDNNNDFEYMLIKKCI